MSNEENFDEHLSGAALAEALESSAHKACGVVLNEIRCKALLQRKTISESAPLSRLRELTKSFFEGLLLEVKPTQEQYDSAIYSSANFLGGKLMGDNISFSAAPPAANTRTTLNVQAALEELRADIRARGLSYLATKGINFKSSSNLTIFDYDQIEVNWDYIPAQICRGLILDSETLEVVSFPMTKFFNLGEGRAAPIDWSNCRVWEKLDGSMVSRFWNPRTESWENSTRYQLPDDLKVNTIKISSWQNLIDRCLGVLDLSEQPKTETWVFEVMSPLNMVVVNHQSYYAKLLFIRDNNTLEERSISFFPSIPKSFSFSSEEEILAYAKTLNAIEQEGFVVESGGARVKVKGDQYVYLHRIASNVGSVKNKLLLVRGNDFEEVLAYFPHLKPSIDLIAGVVEAEIAKHESVFARLEHLAAGKEFALAVQKEASVMSAVLFQAKKGSSVRHAFASLTEGAWLKYFQPLVEPLLFDEGGSE